MTLTVHNFAKPARLPGDSDRRLEGWFRAAWSLATRAWARDVPVRVEAQVRGLDLVRLGDLSPQFSDRLVGMRVPLGAPPLPTLLVVPRPLLLALTGALLGEESAGPLDDRDLTTVELSLAEHFLTAHWLPPFVRTWPGAAEPRWQAGPPESLAQCGRQFAQDEPLVAFAWTLTGDFGAADCWWFFRRAGLAELLGADEGTATPIEAVPARLEALVRGLPLPLAIELGSVELPLAQLSQLRVGDLVLLGQRTAEPLTARVGDREKFRGWAGRSGSSWAFQIASLIEE